MPADPILAAPLANGVDHPAEHDSTAAPLGGRRGLDVPTLGMVCTVLDGAGLARTFDALPDARRYVRVAVDIDAPLGFEVTRRLPAASTVDDVLAEGTRVLADVGWVQVSPWRNHPDQAGSKAARFLHPDVGVDVVTGELTGALPAPTSDPVGA